MAATKVIVDLCSYDFSEEQVQATTASKTFRPLLLESILFFFFFTGYYPIY